MLDLSPIERREKLAPKEFKETYLKHKKPVVFTDLMDSWPAKEKWSFDFFKNEHGDHLVPVYAGTGGKTKGYMKPDKIITFREYITSIENGENNYRMFLFNIAKEIPELVSDIKVPKEMMSGFMKSFAFMFFGSKGSKVRLHFDLDMSHLFLNQFQGIKRVVLFPHAYSKNLYHQPFTVASFIDVNNPDYERYPALKYVKGYEVFLQPGETLFIPSGVWHYVEYTEASFSINNRANDSLLGRVNGFYHIAKHFTVDRGMNKILGEKWRDIKSDLADKRAKGAIYHEV